MLCRSEKRRHKGHSQGRVCRRASMPRDSTDYQMSGSAMSVGPRQRKTIWNQNYRSRYTFLFSPACQKPDEEPILVMRGVPVSNQTWPSPGTVVLSPDVSLLGLYGTVCTSSGVKLMRNSGRIQRGSQTSQFPFHTDSGVMSLFNQRSIDTGLGHLRGGIQSK